MYAASLIPLSENVSRLDLQVTIEGEPGAHPCVAQDAYEARGAARRGGRKIGRTYLQNSQGGATCYLGSRRSDLMGRVYDKGVERGDQVPGTTWRWELELKRDLADLTARELVLVEQLEEAIGGLVSQSFDEWGVPLPPMFSSLPMHRCHRQASDVERTLRWLEVGVRPSVDYLRSRGLLREALRALGLDTPTTDSIRQN